MPNMNDELRNMLMKLDHGEQNDIRSQITSMKAIQKAMWMKLAGDAIEPGVDDNGLSLTQASGLNLEQDINNANAQWINWWLPIGLASDDVTRITRHAIGIINGELCLVVSGIFSSIGGVRADNIALYKYSTRQWYSIVDGISSGGVNALLIHNGSLYIAGDFLNLNSIVNADRIAKYDGASWSALGSGLNGTVTCLSVDSSSNIIAGGSFSDAGGDVNADYIAKWNGAAWSAVGTTPLNGVVYSISVDNADNIYAVGEFINAGGDANADRVAKHDGITWSALGSGSSIAPSFIAVHPNSQEVYVTSISSVVCGVSGYIAKWDGVSWSSVGGGLNASVRHVAFDAVGNVYYGGNFTDAGGSGANTIAYYDGVSWHKLTNAGGVAGLSGYVQQIGFDPVTNTIYAIGDFDTAGTVQCMGIAAFCRPLSDALDIIAGLFEQYQARADAKYAATANGVTNGDAHNHSGGDGGKINHAALSNIGTNDHPTIDTFIASKAAVSGLASLDASSRVVQAVQRVLAGTAAVTATEGYVEWQSTTKRLLAYDAQRERSLSSIGWTPAALPLIYDPSAALTTAYAIAANGGTLAIPILVTGHMLLQGVTVRNTDAASARAWRWHLYEQYANNGDAGENTLTRIESGNGNDSFTAAAASNRTLNGTAAPMYLAPGVYWLAIQNVHATNTFGLGSTAAGSAFAPNSAQSKTLTVPLGATLDMVAATWAKLADIYGVRLNGRVFGQTTAF